MGEKIYHRARENKDPEFSGGVELKKRGASPPSQGGKFGGRKEEGDWKRVSGKENHVAKSRSVGRESWRGEGRRLAGTLHCLGKKVESSGLC